MKSSFSLPLIVCLVGLAPPVTAQEQTQKSVSVDLSGSASLATADPLARAVTREATRLGAAGEATGDNTVQQGGNHAESTWSRVRKLALDTEIVRVKGSPPAQRDVATGDDVGLKVLKVADPTLVRAARLAVANLNGDAQTPAQSADDVAWSRVQRLSAGGEVRVVGGNGASSEGAFQTADGASITLLIAGHEQNTTRANVHQVSVVRDTDRWQHVVIGMVIGGVAGGIAVGLHCRGEFSSCKEVAPAYTAPGLGIGAAVGALLPPGKHWQEIYVRSGV
jgi:hypothetical protein